MNEGVIAFSKKVHVFLRHPVDHARYEEPYAQEMGTRIWGSCYNSTLCANGIIVICAYGKNINSRFRIKIKASYIVSTEGDIRRFTLYWPLKQSNKH